MERGYEFRIYPDAAQRAQIEHTFGCCRWTWNRAFALRQETWEDSRESAGPAALMKVIPEWKRENPWLAEVDSMALQQAVRDLGRAYENFFRNVRERNVVGPPSNPYGFPQFKSKRARRQSYRTQNFSGKNVVVVDSRHVKLPKLGIVKCRVSREVEGRIVNATVKRTPTGKYFVVLCCKDCQPPACGPGRVPVMGVDAGIKDIATCSDGSGFAAPRALRKAEKRLAREQRRLARKQGYRKGERKSVNYEKQRARVARVHEKVANRRKDALHKATTAIIRESQAVAVEDLNVKGMMANHNIAKAAADASMGELLRQLEYKAAWHGRGFVKIGRWEATTQTCSQCGAKTGPRGMQGLWMRGWTCHSCGAVHDRDLNAARNIARLGEKLLEGTAGHAGTRAA